MNVMTRLIEIAKELTKVPLKAADRDLLLEEHARLVADLESEAPAGMATPKSADPKVHPQVSRVNGAMDPWMGVQLELGWHYVRVAEHQVGLGLASNKLKFLRMGYNIAPCDGELRQMMDDGKVWIMRIEQAKYDERVAKSREESKANRAASKQVNTAEGLMVTENVETKKSIAEIANG